MILPLLLLMSAVVSNKPSMPARAATVYPETQIESKWPGDMPMAILIHLSQYPCHDYQSLCDMVHVDLTMVMERTDWGSAVREEWLDRLVNDWNKVDRMNEFNKFQKQFDASLRTQ